MLRVYPQRENYTADLIHGFPVIVTAHRGLSAFRIDPVNHLGDGKDKLPGHSYHNELITPYRYSVDLDEEEIQADFAPAHQSAIYRFSFRKGNARLILTTAKGNIKVEEDGGVQAYQVISPSLNVYLYLKAEKKPVRTEIRKTAAGAGKEQATSLVLSFDVPDISIRYGVSYISAEQAAKNLKREINHYDIEALAASGREEWNRTLGKINVEGCDENAKTVFYTALYRTYERMVCISEDGRYYSGMDHLVHPDDGIPFYTDDWLWDTYLALHPLRVIIEPEREQNMIRSLILYAQQSPEGWLPTFPEVHGDNHSMNGNHAIAAIWDAYVKGLRGFDINAAYKAARKTLTEKSIIPWRRIPLTKLDRIYNEKGFFPALEPGEKETFKEVDSFEKRQAVAITLAACFDDWCLSQMAKTLGKEDDYHFFNARSLNYRNIYKPETGFFHPKNSKGKFIEPFDYIFSGGAGARDYYDENHGWTYRWGLQQNIAGLIELMGGASAFIDNLDRTFREPLGKGRHEFYAQLPDHTGNAGQFSMGNEPSFHIPYLYIYGGEPWKTQKRIRTLLTQWFRNDLMGIPGDEDGGGMSAFVVFSSLGFYPVTPGLPVYVIGSPVFEKAEIQLGYGKTFTVQSLNYSPGNKYIQSARLNGKEWNKAWFTHRELMQGGVLELTMGKQPNKQWASGPEALPPSSEAALSQIAGNEPEYVYADFNHGQNDNRVSDWVQSIQIVEPACRSEVEGTIEIKFRAPGMSSAKAFCWQQPTAGDPNPWGHRVDLAPEGIELGEEESGTFTFPAAEFPAGPVNIRIFAHNEEGKKDLFELQLYNNAGVVWNRGIPAHDPPAAQGLQLVFSDDFDGELSISNDGKNARYSAHKPPHGDFSGWQFSDVTGPDNPFEQTDSYLKIKARKRPGTKGSSGLIASVNMDGEGFFTKAPCYLECRFVAQSAPGAWPAFWTLSAFDGTPGDELDIIEAYGGMGKGNANLDGQYCIVSHFWGQKNPDGSPKKGYDTRVPMTQLGGKSNWTETFHTYAVYVGLDETVYYFDDIEVLRHPTNDASREKPIYFLVNYAIGGISGWPIDLERYANGSDMYVDYVRVYAEKPLNYAVPGLKR
jgi:predicted alpha-1,2-mannosidase